MTLKLTKKEINGLFEAQKSGLITSDTLQKIILAASQDEVSGTNEEVPKQTWQGQEIYCKVDAFSKKIVSDEQKRWNSGRISSEDNCYDENGRWRYII